MLLATVAIVLSVAQEQWNGPAGTPRCGDIYTDWVENFAAGERAFFMESCSYVCDGNDCDVVGGFDPKYCFSCAVKGPGGRGTSTVLDPYVSYHMIGATSEFHSGKPCRFLEKIGYADNGRAAPEPDMRRLQSEYGSGAVESDNCSNANTDICDYPPPHAGLTQHQFTGLALGEWKGLLMDMGNLNGASPHINHNNWAAAEAFSHRPIYGIANASVCDDSSDFSQVGAERAWYNGGVLIEKARGPNHVLTTRSFMFKTDAHRALAAQDRRNRGLEYAKTFAGENGCDTEVVWEIKPMSGGGIDMELTTPLDATSCETEKELRNNIAVHFTGDEVVVSVTRRALTYANFLDSACADASGYKELVRFAANFVCAATGEEVVADIIYLDDRDQPYAPNPSTRAGGGVWNGQTILPLSRDASNPTPFYTGVGVNYLQPGGYCTTGGISHRPHGGRFQIRANASVAPESCGTFFWDPLLSAVPGDGFAWKVQDGVLVAMDMRAMGAEAAGTLASGTGATNEAAGDATNDATAGDADDDTTAGDADDDTSADQTVVVAIAASSAAAVAVLALLVGGYMLRVRRGMGKHRVRPGQKV